MVAAEGLRAAIQSTVQLSQLPLNNASFVIYLFTVLFLCLLRVYSHQESPIVHLLWSGPNRMFLFFLFGTVRFHTARFSSEPEIVNKTTRVLRSSIHWTEILKQGKAGSSKTG